MIDDNCARALVPASKIGMKTVWYKLSNESQCSIKSDWVIDKLEDLLDIF